MTQHPEDRDRQREWDFRAVNDEPEAKIRVQI